MGLSIVQYSVVIVIGLLGFRNYKTREREYAKSIRNDKWAQMENLWSEDQIEQIKNTMRQVGIFRATSGIDNKATMDHIGERVPLRKG